MKDWKNLIIIFLVIGVFLTSTISIIFLAEREQAYAEFQVYEKKISELNELLLKGRVYGNLDFGFFFSNEEFESLKTNVKVYLINNSLVNFLNKTIRDHEFATFDEIIIYIEYETEIETYGDHFITTLVDGNDVKELEISMISLVSESPFIYKIDSSMGNKTVSQVKYIPSLEVWHLGILKLRPIHSIDYGEASWEDIP